MAVLVEAISVIVRRDAVEDRYPGGWQGFLRHVPNATLCSDRDLARVGFMTPTDVEAYCSTLEAEGLVFQDDGRAVDFAVVDQFRGPTFPARWIEFGKIETDGMKLSACWLAGQSRNEIALPEGWRYDSSLSAKPRFETENTINDLVKFLRRENGIDVYQDLSTETELYTGRPIIRGDSEPAIHTRLETICHEILNIEAKMQALQEKQGLAPLFHRLDEILLTVQLIIGGDGSQMSFAHFTLGLILRIIRRREEAEQAFRKANELQPGVINTLLELVRCLGEQGKDGEALPFAREAVNVAPMDAGAWGNLAMCLIQCKQREEARRTIVHAIELDPLDPINRYIHDNFDDYF